MTNNPLLLQFEQAFRESLGTLRSANRALSLSDIYVMFDTENESVSIYDDMEELLCTGEMNGLSAIDINEDFLPVAKKWLAQKEVIDAIETIHILKPFSVVWVDEYFAQIEELLTIDDDNMIINNELMDKIDAELNEFLKKLLEDV
ncbi:MAG: hypothetical protein ACK5JU_07315 [Bacteroidales bacterium]